MLTSGDCRESHREPHNASYEESERIILSTMSDHTAESLGAQINYKRYVISPSPHDALLDPMQSATLPWNTA